MFDHRFVNNVDEKLFQQKPIGLAKSPILKNMQDIFFQDEPERKESLSVDLMLVADNHEE